MKPEQSNDARFLVKDGVFVEFRNHFIKMGKAKDISKGGLSFEHVYEDDITRDPLKGAVSLWVNEFRISKVSCRVVYDISLPKPPEYQLLTIQFDTRRCGVQFDELSDDQMAQLDFFLRTYTEGIAP